MRLENKKAIITGAASGFGAGIAKKFIQEGADVIVADINEKMANKAAIDLGERAHSFPVDVSNSGSVTKLRDFSLSHFGIPDIIINNAGITKDNLILRMDQDAWKKVIDINLNSCFNLTKCSIREFIKKKEGVIINISSIVGVKGNAGQSNYAASKAGVNGFTKSIALELASRNIRCNAIAPGFIETDMTSKDGSGLLDKWIESIPLKRAGIVDDVSELCLFLASDKASYITGQIINVDGGLVT